ncbi:MAG: hypothetical protein AAF526_13705 [Pseudomonadota bacterium]
MRAALWVRNPPSPARVKFVLGVIVIAILIVAVEALGLWPDALTVERHPRRLPGLGD